MKMLTMEMANRKTMHLLCTRCGNTKHFDSAGTINPKDYADVICLVPTSTASNQTSTKKRILQFYQSVVLIDYKVLVQISSICGDIGMHQVIHSEAVRGIIFHHLYFYYELQRYPISRVKNKREN